MDTSAQLTMHAALGTEGWELLRLADDRQANRCTAACLDARQELRAVILGALAEGQGTRTVAAAFGVSREVVRALRRQALESGELDQHKQRLGLDALSLAKECVDRIRDEIDEMPRASLPIIAGVMVDKAQILTGGATSRIERVDAPSHADLNAWIDSLPRAEPVPSRESTAQKGGADIGGQVLELPAGELAGDIPSPVLCPSTEGEQVERAEDGQEGPQREARA